MRNGWSRAVATCGARIERDHARAIADAADCCLLWLDDDDAGQRAGHIWSEQLRRFGVESRFLKTSDYKDANDALLQGGREEVIRLVKAGIEGYGEGLEL